MLLFCAKTIVKGSRKFELACLKKKNRVYHLYDTVLKQIMDSTWMLYEA